MKKRTVLQFADFAAPYEGNFLKSLQSLERRLSLEQITMVYLFVASAKTQPWVEKFISDGKHIYFLTGNFIKDVFLVRKLIIKYNVGIVHAHFANTKEIMILRYARIWTGKTILIRHVHNTYHKNNNFVKEKIKKCLNHTNYDVACGLSVAQGLIQAGIKQNKVSYVTNGVDFERLENYQDLKKEDLNMEADAKTALMFGYDYMIKGVDVALEAMHILNQYEKAYLLISVAKNKEDIIKKVKDKFGEFPSWLRLLEPRNDIATYYRLADVFISASREEGLCYTLLEVAYIGKIIVASDIGGHSVLPGMYRFKTEDSFDLSEKLKSAFTLTQLQRTEIEQREKEYVIEHFNIKKWSDEMYGFYEKISNLNKMYD